MRGEPIPNFPCHTPVTLICDKSLKTEPLSPFPSDIAGVSSKYALEEFSSPLEGAPDWIDAKADQIACRRTRHYI